MSRAPRDAVARLQWGRRSSSAEISQVSSVRDAGVALLQWGRRSSSAEIDAFSQAQQWRYGASMGPPIIVGGDVTPTGLGQHTVLIRFNGAADHRRRRSPFLLPEGIPWICFNGAADHRRRRYDRVTLCSAEVDASMGPPIIVGGDELSAAMAAKGCADRGIVNTEIAAS